MTWLSRLLLLPFIATAALATIHTKAHATNRTNATAPLVGPPNGHAVVIGGNLQSQSIYERIISLAGGPNAPLIVIPTAGGDATYSNNFSTASALRRWGATNVMVLHTYDRAVADTEAFATPLASAGGVFFGGGRQWRLVDAYAGTRTERAIRAVLDRGGVIAGSSAGASIQGSFLARGDTRDNQVMVGDHTVGFGYLRNVAIDQHVITRNRMFDMSQILEAYPDLLGLGCDEDTAFVVEGDRADVIGDTYCLAYDGKFWSEEGYEQKKLPEPEHRFFFLKEGDGYQLAERRVLSDRVSTG